MQIYNITQEKVTELVNKAFDSDDRPKNLSLTDQNRLDVICYVLNRAKPVYVLSERGISHLKDNYSNSLQELADLTRLVENGINLIAKTQRADKSSEIKTPKRVEAKAYYNFPTISGAVLSGDTFAPVNAEVSISYDNKILEMKDANWNNPMTIDSYTNGNYLFWPNALPADEPGLEKTFLFHISIKSEGFEDSSHFFELKVTSTKEFNEKFEAHNSYTCSNILLFKEEE